MDSERRNAIWIFFYTLALSSKERREGLKALRVWCKTAGTGERTAVFGPVPYICMWLSDVNGEKKQDRILWKFVQKMSPTQDCQSRRQNGEFEFPADTCEKCAACFYCRFFGHCILCSENRRRAGRVLQPKKESLERGAEGKKRCNGFHFPIRTTAWLFFKSWFVRSTGVISLLFLFVLKNACVFNSNMSIK